MAAITRGWMDLRRSYSVEKVEEIVQFLNRRGCQLVMFDAAVGRPEDMLREKYNGQISLDCRVFIDDEDDAIFFALKYL